MKANIIYTNKFINNFYLRLIFVILSCIIIYAITALLSHFVGDKVHNMAGHFVSVLGIFTIIYVVIRFNKHWNNYSIKDIGFNFSLIPSGIVIGILSALIVISILLLTSYFIEGSGKIIIYSYNDMYLTNVYPILAFYFLVAIWEEVVFRGYMLTTLLKRNSVFMSILISSIFFAAIHLPMYKWDFIAGFAILNYSIFISYVYLYTGNLWIPVFYHWIWNCMYDFLKDTINKYGVISISQPLYETYYGIIHYGLFIIALIFILISIKIKPKFPFKTKHT